MQTCWGHVNPDSSLLTRAQALGIDGHFVVEQYARDRLGAFMNFNGTGGVWRRQAMETAGGWQGDTLTEDLDLSYRAQFADWRIVLSCRFDCAGRIYRCRWMPLSASNSAGPRAAFKTAIKLMSPPMAKRPQPLWKKILGTFHLTHYAVSSPYGVESTATAPHDLFP